MPGQAWANFSQDLSTCRAALAALQLLQEEQFLQQNALDCAQAGSADISLYLPYSLSLSLSPTDLFAQMYFACCRRAVSIVAKAGRQCTHSSLTANGASQLLFYPHIIFSAAVVDDLLGIKQDMLVPRNPL